MIAKVERFVPLGILTALCLAAGNAVADSAAADDPRKFVEALRQRGYLDTAADYLDYLSADATLPDETKRVVPFEHAAVLIESAAAVNDPQLRSWQLDQAQAKLKQFLAASPDDEQAQTARERLGGLLRYRAERLMQETDKSGSVSSANRTQAGAMYADARTLFDEAARRYRADLDKLPKGEQPELREQIGTSWLGSLLNAARATFDKARTFEPASAEAQQLLNDAAAQCKKLHDEYPQRLAGVTARFYEGRCYQELGDSKTALSAYNQLIAELPDGDPVFRQLKTQALRFALECWIQDKNYAAAVDKSLAWSKSARGTELQDPDWLTVKRATATALQELAATLPKNDFKAKSYLRDARDLAVEVLRSNSPAYQSQAHELIAQLGGRASEQERAASVSVAASTSAAAEAKLTTFDEIYQRANDAVDQLKSDQLELDLLQQEHPPDAARIAELKADISKRSDEAFALMQRAVAAADAKTDPDKLNFARYLLCYFHYQKQRYYESAVLGEYLAKKFPDSVNARPASRVALAALDALYRQQKEAGDKDLTFERNKIFDLAGYITDRWADMPEADLALDLLIGFYINSGDYDKSVEILSHIKSDSPRRPAAEIKLGQALWNKYLRTMQQVREQKSADSSGSAGPEDAKVKKELDALAKQSQEVLEQGIAGLRKQGQVNSQTVLGAQSLAQLYVALSHAEKAVAILEDPKLGPLTLLKENHPAVQVTGLPAEIQKTALRAYMGVEPQQLEKATAAMDALQQIYANDPEGEARLTQLLVSLAYDLQQQLEELDRQGNRQQQIQLTKAVEQFLHRISQRASGADFRTLNWVAATYDSLAEGLKQDNKLTPDGKSLYQQSAKIYEDILSRAADEKFLPADKLPGIKLRAAIAQRNAGNYDKAISVLAELLKEKPQLLPAQVEAAKTYQLRGDNENPDFYVPAIKGGGKGSAENIWGWGKLALQTSRDPQFRDIFHEARYNIAVCRSRFGETRTDKAEKKQLLTLAKNDIRNTRQFEPTLGGEKWKPLYDKLLRNIQQQLHEPVVGLKDLDQKDTAPPADAEKS